MSIGTPPQVVRLLPSTSANAIWPVHPQGCTKDDPSDCPNTRGSFFTSDNSTSWKDIGLYELGLQNEISLGYSGNASLGYDSVRIGIADASSTVIPNQVIEAIATKDFYNGFIGLNGNAVNISSTLNSSTSFLTSLSNSRVIPGRSWAYTAGASWADPPVYGSLVLGGYDASLIAQDKTDTKVEARGQFPFGPDENRELILYVQDVSGHPKLAGSSGAGFSIVLNSAVPDIWLPEKVCGAFESAFNLQYNATANRYFLNSTAYTAIQQLDPNITFSLATSATDTAVNITMSWQSFDLVDKSTEAASHNNRYFAIRRGQNTTQYTLGRAFFQDAYVITDWERAKFWVHQAVHPSLDTQSSVKLISSISSGSVKRDTGAYRSEIIVGSVAGGLGFLLLISGLLLFFYLRRRRTRKEQGSTLKSSDASTLSKSPHDDEFRKAELDAGPSKAELCSNFGSIYKRDDAETPTTELPTPLGTWRSELPGSMQGEKVELFGSPGGHETDAGFTGHEAYAGVAGHEADAGPACAELEGDIPEQNEDGIQIGQAF